MTTASPARRTATVRIANRPERDGPWLDAAAAQTLVGQDAYLYREGYLGAAALPIARVEFIEVTAEPDDLVATVRILVSDPDASIDRLLPPNTVTRVGLAGPVVRERDGRVTRFDVREMYPSPVSPWAQGRPADRVGYDAFMRALRHQLDALEANANMVTVSADYRHASRVAADGLRCAMSLAPYFPGVPR